VGRVRAFLGFERTDMAGVVVGESGWVGGMEVEGWVWVRVYVAGGGWRGWGRGRGGDLESDGFLGER